MACLTIVTEDRSLRDVLRLPLHPRESVRLYPSSTRSVTIATHVAGLVRGARVFALEALAHPLGEDRARSEAGQDHLLEVALAVGLFGPAGLGGVRGLGYGLPVGGRVLHGSHRSLPASSTTIASTRSVCARAKSGSLRARAWSLVCRSSARSSRSDS